MSQKRFRNPRPAPPKQSSTWKIILVTTVVAITILALVKIAVNRQAQAHGDVTQVAETTIV